MKRTRLLLALTVIASLALALAPAASHAGGPPSGGGASKAWYLAEGCTGDNPQGFFETFVVVANPGKKSAHVTLWHQLDTPNTAYGGNWPGAAFDLAPGTRQTVNVADTIRTANPNPVHEWNVSTYLEATEPVVAERSMYWTDKAVVAAGGMGRQAAMESVGLVKPATKWYLAEGCSNLDASGGIPMGFETWVTIQNTSSKPANINIKYQTTNREVAGPTFQMPPKTRTAVNIADTVKEDSVSTTVNSDQPVVVERSMYYSGLDTFDNPVARKCGHTSTGVTQAKATWYLPMGLVKAIMTNFDDTYILVQNPGSAPATVDVDFVGDGSSNKGKLIKGYKVKLAPHTRRTVGVGRMSDNDHLLTLFSSMEWFATVVKSNQPVIAEKAVYYTFQPHYLNSNENVSGMGSIGLPELANKWFLAEGSTAETSAGSFTTYVGIANYSASPRSVQVSYQTPKGPVAGPKFNLGPYTLKAVNVGDTVKVKNQWSVSSTVEADDGVAVERVMYWTVDVPEVKGNPGSESATSCGGVPGD